MRKKRKWAFCHEFFDKWFEKCKNSVFVEKLPNWSNFMLNKYKKTREFRQQKWNKNGFSSFLKILSMGNEMENKVLQEKKTFASVTLSQQATFFLNQRKKNASLILLP